VNIPNIVDSLSEKIAVRTKKFVQTRLGKLFLGLVLLGPITFIPTAWAAWTDPNIDSLRTLTWPLMVVVNSSATLGVMHKGSWEMRLVMMVWIVMMLSICLALLVR